MIDLSPASVDAVAERVVELLQGTDAELGQLVDAAEIARRFSVSLDYVYDHADRLGAVRLGDGPKARLRFNPTVVAERLEAPAPSPSTPSRSPRRSRRPSDAELLPIRGPVR